MATKDDTMREDDGQDGKDGQPGSQQQTRNDSQALRPVDDLPPIKRGGADEQSKPEYEIVEVGEDGKPLDGSSSERGNRDGEEEGNLSEDQVGERSYLDQQRQDARGGKRDSRRELPRERRERRKVAREHERAEAVALRREVADLRGELDQFKTGAEKRLNAADSGRLQGDLTRLEQDIARLDETRKAAETKQREALGAQDADAFMVAQTARDEAVIAKVRLENQRDSLKARLDTGRRTARTDDGDDDRQDDRGGRREGDTGQRQQPQQPAPLTGPAKRFADDFLRTHDWMDPRSRDPEVRRDSQRVRFLDAEVTAEGYDPNSQEYWDELESRMRDFMPHVFEEDEDEQRTARNNGRQHQNGRSQNGNGAGNGNGNGNGRAPNGQQAQPRRGGPPIADVGGRGGNGRKTQVKISPERKRAMIEAGSLNPDGSIANQVKFERTLREFAVYDAREGAGR